MTPRPLKIQGCRPSTGLSSVRWSYRAVPASTPTRAEDEDEDEHEGWAQYRANPNSWLWKNSVRRGAFQSQIPNGSKQQQTDGEWERESPGLLEGRERGQGRFPSCPSLLPQESSSPRAQALWRVERATSRDPRRAADRRCYCPLLMRSYVGRGTLKCCCTAAGPDEYGPRSVQCHWWSVLGLFWLSGAPPGRIK